MLQSSTLPLSYRSGAECWRRIRPRGICCRRLMGEGAVGWRSVVSRLVPEVGTNVGISILLTRRLEICLTSLTDLDEGSRKEYV